MVKVKQALAKLEGELVGMDVQIGVIEQAMLQAQLRDRTYFSNEAFNEANTFG
jgi:hypothetical protein